MQGLFTVNTSVLLCSVCLFKTKTLVKMCCINQLFFFSATTIASMSEALDKASCAVVLLHLVLTDFYCFDIIMLTLLVCCIDG